ncbi:MAG: 7-cyano-7-deazaguanine synthase [Acutalibacteraceae bacterium]
MNEQKLMDWFAEKGNAAIAFSGGVDSTFLLAVAHKALGNKVKAYTCQSAFVPEWELDEARAFCKAEGIEMEVIPLDVLADPAIVNNPINRCYLCKRRCLEPFCAGQRKTVLLWYATARIWMIWEIFARAPRRPRSWE